MSLRDEYPGIARLVDEFRACGLASGARFTLTENGRTFQWIDPVTQDVSHPGTGQFKQQNPNRRHRKGK